MNIYITDSITGETRPAKTFDEIVSNAQKTPIDAGKGLFSAGTLQGAVNSMKRQIDAEKLAQETERRARKINEVERKKAEEKRRNAELKRIFPKWF